MCVFFQRSGYAIEKDFQTDQASFCPIIQKNIIMLSFLFCYLSHMLKSLKWWQVPKSCILVHLNSIVNLTLWNSLTFHKDFFELSTRFIGKVV